MKAVTILHSNVMLRYVVHLETDLSLYVTHEVMANHLDVVYFLVIVHLPLKFGFGAS